MNGERPSFRDVMRPVGYALGVGALGFATLRGDVLPGSMDDDFRAQMEQLQAADNQQLEPVQEPTDIPEENTALPPITSPAWPEYAAHEQVLGGTYYNEAGDLRTWFDPAVPVEHQAAFDGMIEQPIVQIALEDGDITQFELRAAEPGRDNGHFYPDTNVASLEISTDTNLYFDTRVMESIGNHEATHAAVDVWFQRIWDGTRPDDPLLSGAIDRIDSLCRDYRNQQFASLINQHGRELSASYRKTAVDFENRAIWENNDGDATNDGNVPSYEAYADGLVRAADSIDRRDPDILVNFADQPCTYVGSIDLLPLIPDNDANWTRDMTDFVKDGEPDLIDDLYASQRLNVMEAEATFACIDDGRALTSQLDQIVPAGHPYDDATEAAASMIASLEANPTQMLNCLESMPPGDKAHLLAYMDALLDATALVKPELIAQIHDHPAGTAVVYQARQAGLARERRQAADTKLLAAEQHTTLTAA